MSFQSRFEGPDHDHVDDFADCDEMPKIINIQRKLKKGLVKNQNGKVFPVTLQDWLADSIELLDYVELKKSPVTGEMIVTDYKINMEVYGAIHNSYQDNYDDMVTDDKGVPL